MISKGSEEKGRTGREEGEEAGEGEAGGSEQGEVIRLNLWKVRETYQYTLNLSD